MRVVDESQAISVFVVLKGKPAPFIFDLALLIRHANLKCLNQFFFLR